MGNVMGMIQTHDTRNPDNYLSLARAAGCYNAGTYPYAFYAYAALCPRGPLDGAPRGLGVRQAGDVLGNDGSRRPQGGTGPTPGLAPAPSRPALGPWSRLAL